MEVTFARKPYAQLDITKILMEFVRHASVVVPLATQFPIAHLVQLIIIFK